MEKLLVTGGKEDPSVRVWDVVSGKLVQTLQEHKHGVHCVAWSLDSEMLATFGEQDDLLILWDAKTWQARSLDHKIRYAEIMAWLPDGKTLAVIGGNGTVNFLNTRTGQLDGTAKGPWTPIALALDQQMVASAWLVRSTSGT